MKVSSGGMVSSKSIISIIWKGHFNHNAQSTSIWRETHWVVKDLCFFDPFLSAIAVGLLKPFLSMSKIHKLQFNPDEVWRITQLLCRHNVQLMRSICKSCWVPPDTWIRAANSRIATRGTPTCTVPGAPQLLVLRCVSSSCGATGLTRFDHGWTFQVAK